VVKFSRIPPDPRSVTSVLGSGTSVWDPAPKLGDRYLKIEIRLPNTYREFTVLEYIYDPNDRLM